MSYLGENLLAAVFLFCGFATVFGLVALMLDSKPARKILRWARGAMFVAVVLSVAVLILLVVAFLVNDFSLAIVGRHSSIEQDLFYKVSAIWAGSAGSLLLWSVCAFVFLGLWLADCETDNVRFNALALSIGAGVCWGFAALLVFLEKPFTASLVKIENGAGLNPLLRNFWMVVHPPLLFVGYAAFLVPFVIVSAGVFAGSLAEAGLYRQLRRWLLLGICFLGLGIATGAKWSYIELGWGGYWSWDPVENASLLPWLVAVAALHSLGGMKYYDRFRRWVVILSPVPFILCLVATFVTRSGILMSVHSFGNNVMFSVLLVFIGCCFFLWLLCVVRAVKSISTTQSRMGMFSLDSNWMLFLANGILIFTAVVIGTATFWPVISRFLAGPHWGITLTSVFYDRVVSAAAVLLAVLMGFAALIDLRERGSFTLCLLSAFVAAMICFSLVVKFYENQLLIAVVAGICAFSFMPVLIKLCFGIKAGSEIGSGVAHLGLLLLVAAVGLSSSERVVRTQVGEGWEITLKGYRLSYNLFSHKLVDGITQAGPEIVIRKKDLQTKLWPHNSLYPSGQMTSEVAVCTRLLEDVYISFDGVDPDGRQIITVKIKPLMLWFWFALLLIVAGPALAMFEGKEAAEDG